MFNMKFHETTSGWGKVDPAHFFHQWDISSSAVGPFGLKR